MNQETSPHLVRLGRRLVDLSRGEVDCEGTVTSLTPTEVLLLRRLLQANGEPTHRDVLLADVWGYREGVKSRTVDATINRLRKKLEDDPSNPAHLLAKYGRGWWLDGAVIDAEPPSSPERWLQDTTGWAPGDPRSVEFWRRVDPNPEVLSVLQEPLRTLGTPVLYRLDALLQPLREAVLAPSTVADRELLYTLSAFQQSFSFEDAVSLTGTSHEAIAAFLARATELAWIGVEAQWYTVRHLVRSVPDAAARARLTTLCNDPERTLRHGFAWLSHHLEDLFSVEIPDAAAAGSFALILLDVVFLLPESRQRALLALEDLHERFPTDQVWVRWVGGFIGCGEDLRPETEARLKQLADTGLLEARVHYRHHVERLGRPQRADLLSWAVEPTADPVVEARVLGTPACHLPLPDYLARTRRLRQTARKRGWREVLRFLRSADTSLHVLHEDYESVLELTASRPSDLLVHRGVAALGLGRLDDAREAVSLLEKLGPPIPDQHLLGAMVSACAGDDSAATAAVHRSLEIGVDPACASVVEGLLSELLGTPASNDWRVKQVLEGSLPEVPERITWLMALHHVVQARRGR